MKMTTRDSDTTTLTWRQTHTITDWEFAEIGKLLCDHQARDLALKVVRLEGQIEMLKERAA